MQDRDRVDTEDLRGKLYAMRVRPDMGRRVDSLGEHKVVFRYLTGHKWQSLTIRFPDKRSRDQWMNAFAVHYHGGKADA